MAGDCVPLTTLENWLRKQAGMGAYEGDFIEIWLHSLLFFDFPSWVFAYGYTAFGMAVLLSAIVVPPRFPMFLKAIPVRSTKA